jgi:hypothetical protein
MIILQNVPWGTFKKFIELIDADSDKCLFVGVADNFMYCAECDDMDVWCYCRMDGVIEWNIDKNIMLDGINEIDWWCQLFITLRDIVDDDILILDYIIYKLKLGDVENVNN